MDFKIGIIADLLGLPLNESLQYCKELGVHGVQLYTVEGELSPENMDATARAKLKTKLQQNGLEISALCGDLGGHGFTREEENPQKIEKSKKIIDLAVDLGCHIVTTHIGVIPEDENCQTYQILHDACKQLAEYAHQKNACFAIETGPEPAKRLCRFLDNLNTPGIGVNLDPANLVMVTDDDPVSAVKILAPYIVHTHAKDGILLQKTDPKIIYDFFAEGGIGDLRLSDYFAEVPLGQGKVNFPSYLSALNEIGYKGYLTIEREVGDHPKEDIAAAVDFLKTNIKEK